MWRRIGIGSTPVPSCWTGVGTAPRVVHGRCPAWRWQAPTRGRRDVRVIAASSRSDEQQQLQIVFIATEVAPYSKVGGLADVVAALPPALAARGHRVMTVVPRYERYEGAADTGVVAPVELPPSCNTLRRRPPRRFARHVNRRIDAGPRYVRYYMERTQGVDLVFVDSPLFEGQDVYGGGFSSYCDNTLGGADLRFSVLCQAALAAPVLLWGLDGGGTPAVGAAGADAASSTAAWQQRLSEGGLAGMAVADDSGGGSSEEGDLNENGDSVRQLELAAALPRWHSRDGAGGSGGGGRSTTNEASTSSSSHATTTATAAAASCDCGGLGHGEQQQQQPWGRQQQEHTPELGSCRGSSSGSSSSRGGCRSPLIFVANDWPTAPAILRLAHSHHGPQDGAAAIEDRWERRLQQWHRERRPSDVILPLPLQQQQQRVDGDPGSSSGSGGDLGGLPLPRFVGAARLEAAAAAGREKATDGSNRGRRKRSNRGRGLEAAAAAAAATEEEDEEAYGRVPEQDGRALSSPSPGDEDDYVQGEGEDASSAIRSVLLPGAWEPSPSERAGHSEEQPAMPGGDEEKEEETATRVRVRLGEYYADMLALRRRLRGALDGALGALCIHNLAYQGRFPKAQFPRLCLPQGARESLRCSCLVENAPSAAGSSSGGSASRAADNSCAAAMRCWCAEEREEVNWMKAAIREADLLLTVSPGYAAEVAADPGLGYGLQEDIAARGITGIMNGIDTLQWDPQTDPYLPPDARFAPSTAAVAQGKARAKALLQQRLGLAEDPGAPLFAFVGRLTEQKGLDVLVAAAPTFLWAGGLRSPAPSSASSSSSSSSARSASPAASGSGAESDAGVGSSGAGHGARRGTSEEASPLDRLRRSSRRGSAWRQKARGRQSKQMVILGTGGMWEQTAARRLAETFPSQVAAELRFDEPLARLLYAAADFIIVPSRFEPCGLVAQCAARYGAVPIVAATGGLADLMRFGGGGGTGAAGAETEASGGVQPGYVIEPVGRPDDPLAFRRAVEQLLGVLCEAASEYGSPAYEARQAACLAMDLSWEQPAMRWEQALLRLVC